MVSCFEGVFLVLALIALLQLGGCIIDCEYIDSVGSNALHK